MKTGGTATSLESFSLIELLVVTAILGIVIAAIAGSLVGGIKVWDAARDFNEGQAEAALAMAELEQDLVNAFHFFDLSFVGREAGIVFPTVVRDLEGQKMGVGQVSYSLDKRAGKLLKTVEPYPGGHEYSELLVERVEAFDLEYYNLVKADGPGRTWKNAGAVVTGFPARVDIRLAFLSESGAGEIRRTILLPTKVRR